MAGKADPGKGEETSAGVEVVKVEGTSGRSQLFATLEEVLKSGQYVDITLQAMGGQTKVRGEMQAHRLVLLSQCSKLKEQFNNETTQTISLDVDMQDLQTVVQFVYTNEVAIATPDLRGVADVADKLGVEELSKKCKIAELCSQTMCVDNCLDKLALAHQVQDDKAEAKPLAFALTNFCQIRKTKGFKLLPCDLLCKLLCHPDLKTRGPEDRLGAVMTWVKTNSASRMCQLAEVLESLPISGVALWYVDQVLEDPLFEGHPLLMNRVSELLQDNANKPEVKINKASTTSTSQGKADQKTDLLIPESPSLKNKKVLMPPQAQAEPIWKTGFPAVAAAAAKERCFVFVGARIDGLRSNEVMAVRLDRDLQLVSLGQFGALFRKDHISCCVQADTLYAAGLGFNGNELWGYNLLDGSYRQYGCLKEVNGPGNTPIVGYNLTSDDSRAANPTCRAVSAINGDRLCAITLMSRTLQSGQYNSTTYSTTCVHSSFVDIMSAVTGKWLGNAQFNLNHPECTLQPPVVCCSVNKGQQVLMCYSLGDRICICVYNSVQGEPLHGYGSSFKSQAISPRPGPIFGVVCAQGHVVVVSSNATIAVSVSDLLHNQIASAVKERLCHHYLAPNDGCGVTVSSDDSTLMLLGGTARNDGTPRGGTPAKAEHHVYSAHVQDVLWDRGQGWTKVDIAWGLGECLMKGGFDTANITLQGYE